ncbi:MFS general substrate transporter [Russula vinacea]|nr:MFS general substrate transporter [Russula vinacea]
MALFSDTSDEKHLISIDSQQLDTGAHMDACFHTQLDPDESLRIRRKIDRHVLPLMYILYCIQFMDKVTLGNASILGILKATHLTANEYNWNDLLSRISRLPVPAEFGTAEVSRRKMDEFEHIHLGYCFMQSCGLQSFTGLLTVRLILGICEGSITAGFMIVSSMFYTRREYTARVGYWYLMDGIGQVIAGFIGFGTLHIHTTRLEPWQWLMIITGILTLITALLFSFLFPDSPTNAWFLTEDERAKAVRRIKENQTGVENKQFKREQMIEAFTDPRTWLFALFAAFSGVVGTVLNQLQIIVVSFGFNPLQTTLLGCVFGVIGIVSIYTGVTIASRISNSIAWVGIAYYVPSLLGVLLVNFLPWHDKVGLLFSVWMTMTMATSFVLGLTWLSQTTAGHTKKVIANATMLSGMCIGNVAGPFMWRAEYKPRNHVPWTVAGVCYLMSVVLLFSIRVILARENKRRDAEPRDDRFDDVHVMRVDGDGKRTEVKVSKEFLDLTDGQNRDFRYVL